MSTVTGSESKSRGAGNRFSSTGHGLLFEKRKNQIAGIDKMRSNTQMKRVVGLDDEEKKLILQNAAKVNLNRTINVDSYLQKELTKGASKSSN